MFNGIDKKKVYGKSIDYIYVLRSKMFLIKRSLAVNTVTLLLTGYREDNGYCGKMRLATYMYIYTT